jgi:hypothetical protein
VLEDLNRARWASRHVLVPLPTVAQNVLRSMQDWLPSSWILRSMVHNSLLRGVTLFSEESRSTQMGITTCGLGSRSEVKHASNVDLAYHIPIDFVSSGQIFMHGSQAIK